MAADAVAALTEAFKGRAREIGFHLVGVASPEPFRTAELDLVRWLGEGHQGEMAWMNEARARLACRPQDLLPGARSLVVVAVSYRTSEPEDEQMRDSARGRIARYAWGVDYHAALKNRLRMLEQWLRENGSEPDLKTRVFVDSGPLVERDAAVRAGLGFRGKNTNLLTPLGSYVFLGALLTTAELAFDRPAEKTCGSCRLCIDACPTDALAEPYHLAAERCIAYLTIEHRSSVPEALRDDMGAWVFGCDVCQEVCPYNASVKQHGQGWTEFEPRPAVGSAPVLRDLLDMDDDAFRTTFRGTPVKRSKRRGLVRNAAIAAANRGDATARPALERLAAEDPDGVVRESAVWACAKLDARPHPA